MTGVLLARARDVVAQFPFPRAPAAADTTLFIAGHGTRQNENSRQAIDRQVERIRARKPDGETALFDALGTYLDGAGSQDGRKVLVAEINKLVAAIMVDPDAILNTPLDAAEFAKRLADRGVMTRPFFLGMHEQPVFKQMGLFQSEDYPVAERLAKQGLYLPSGMTLTEEQIDRVCSAVREAIR
jgi:hypothetical protein